MNHPRQYLNLTHAQKRIWHLEKLHPGTGMFNNAGTLKIKGKIDCDLLQEAVNIFVMKTDALRLRIAEINGEPQQYVHDYTPLTIPIMDFTKDKTEALYAWDYQQTKTNMPLLDCALFDFAIIVLGDQEGGLFAKVHHIISDAWSVVTFASRVMETYSALLGNEPLPEYQYGAYTDYVIKEQEYLNSNRFIKDRDYWLDKYSELPELTTLKQKKENYNSIKSRRKAFVIPTKESLGIRLFCEQHNISPFTFFLAVLLIYCKRILNKRDIVIGVPVYNRTNHMERNTIGMFVSTVPLRITVDDNLNFLDFVNYVTNEWLGVLKHQKYPYDLLIHELRQTHKGLDTLYDIALSYQNGHFSKNIANLSYEGRWHFSELQVNSLSVHLNDREGDGSFLIDYDHHIPLYSIKEIQYIHDHALNIIKDVLANSQHKLNAIKFIPAEEQQRILIDFNATEREYPNHETLDDLLRHQVTATPNAIAIIAGQEVLTYAEFDELVTKQAAYLQQAGITNNDLVAVLVQRNYLLLVAIFGIVRAGGAFLPIDCDFPPDRIDYELSESQTKLAIVSSSYLDLCEGIVGTFNIDSLPDLPAISLKPVVYHPQDLAYIIYTSGSTGKPKGVMIEQQSIVHFLYVLADIMDFTPGNIVMSAATIAFDLFIMETFPTLFNGGTVVLANEMEVNIPKNMVRLIELTRINKLMTTPSRLQLFLSGEGADLCLKNITEIMTGGDALSDKLLSTLQSLTSARIFNFYGPTEVTIAATYKELTNEKSVNIGKPLPNVKAYILDEHLNPVPIGTHGELYVGGKGLARGYLNQTELTRSRFVDSPFSPDQLIYKTGDLCRWYPMGDIEYLGRIDHQVKIRGFRIELGEIETKILEIPGVTSCAVIDQTDNNQRKYLCAYVVGEQLPKVSYLKMELAKKLPLYMIPSYFIELSVLPLTTSGKLDKLKLPTLDQQPVAVDFEGPVTPTEITLAAIWTKVLATNNIDRYDSFFDIGGDSLSIVAVANEIQQQFNVEVSLEEVYKTPSLKDFALLIDRSGELSSSQKITKVATKRYYPVSSAQKRMFVVAYQDGNLNTAYNLPVAYEIAGSVNIERLQKCFNKLIQRHEILSTRFIIKGEKLVQQVVPSTKLSITVIHIEPSQVKYYISQVVKPFDLTKPPLMRVYLLVTSPTTSVLMMDMHHIVADGTSAVILLDELAKLYRGEKLTPKLLQYKDYAVWSQHQLNNYHKQKAFWLEYLAGDLKPLQLPLDYPRKPQFDNKGASLQLTIPKGLTSQLRLAAQRNGVTMYMLLLAAYNILLSKYTLEEEIIVGSPSAGRTNPDIRDMVGVFINTLPMRNYPLGKLSVEQFLFNVKQNSIQAYEHQNYPFDVMVNELKVHRDHAHNPIFDTMFIYNTFDINSFRLGDLVMHPLKLTQTTAKLDLTLEVFDNSTIMTAQFEYASQLFKQSSIQSLARSYLTILDQVCQKPKIQIKDIDVLTPQVLSMLESFNHTEVKLDHHESYGGRFKTQVQKHPQAVALIADNVALTYHDLDLQSDQVALNLMAHGIQTNDLVGVEIKRGLEMIVALLGVMKANAAYVPIDPHLPTQRKLFMLEDCQAKVLLSDQKETPFEGTSLNIKDLPKMSGTVTDIYRANRLNNLIYTSGSTGKPKGVRILSSSINNLIEAARSLDLFNQQTVAISITTMTFDIFFFETFVPLLFGAKVVIANDNETTQAQLCGQLITQHGVNYLQTTPSRLKIMMESSLFNGSMHQLQLLILGGEEFQPSLRRKIKRYTPARLINGYGPSETTVYSTMADVTKTPTVNIGKPLTNTYTYVLDQYLHQVPINTIGELYIGGAGVSDGYHQRPELTQNRFVTNPFHDGLMYKTGDLCYFQPNGELCYCGRNDNQVKIRGLRIELSEIENLMLNYSGIDTAVVITVKEDQAKQLVAFYTSNVPIDESRLRIYLSQQLPRYMIPNGIIRLETLPLTPGGKIDKLALQSMDYNIQTRVIINSAPTNHTQKQLLRIWKKLLDNKQISIDDSFFDIGGDSLGVMKMQVEGLKYGWHFTTQDIYEYTTIRKISNLIDQGSTNIKSKNQEQNISILPPLAAANQKAHQYNKVILTGATGFLGAHLLYELTINHHASVLCLMRDNRLTAMQRLKERLQFYFGDDTAYQIMAQVKIVIVDLTKNNLGLPTHLPDNINEYRDGVFHCAALTSHYGIVEEFERHNVTATKQLVDFCLKYSLPLLHMSTISVAGTVVNSNPEQDFNFSELNTYIGQNYQDNVYTASKYQAEQLVLGAIEKGLNARIFRLGTLCARLDGKFQINPQNNAFLSRLKTIIAVGAIHEATIKKTCDFTAIDQCAKAIVALGEMAVTKSYIYHVYNHQLISYGELASILSRNSYPVSIANDEEFNKRLQLLANKKQKYALTGIINELNQISHVSNISTSCEITLESLELAKFQWEKPQESYIIKMID